MPFFKLVSLNFPICEVSCKNKKYLHLGQKMLYVGIFGLEFKKPLSYLKSTPSNLSNFKVWWRIKNSYICNNDALIGCFWQQFWRTIITFENSALQFIYCKIWCKKNILKFGTKSAWFANFGAGIWKYYCRFWNQPPWICLCEKCGAKNKNP